MKMKEKGRYQWNVNDLTKYMTFYQTKKMSLTSFLTEIGTILCTSIIANQLIYLLQPSQTNTTYTSIHKHILKSIKAIRRPSQHTFTIFSIKTIIDYIESYYCKYWLEYRKGMVAGLTTFILSRPFDQIDRARDQILLNQKKYQSRIQGLKVVLKHDGFKGLYKNQNILGPLCSSIYFSIFFGMCDRLNQYNKNKNYFLQFILFPFAASISASLSTLLPDKFRRFCLQINEERSRSIQRKYRKQKVELKYPSQLLAQYINSDKFGLTRNDIRITAISVLKNWIILSTFVVGQHFRQKYIQN